MELVLSALLIFLLRITDVSIGTIRVIYMVRGRRGVTAVLGLMESGVFIFAISRVLGGDDLSALDMIGYACGFATGTVVGMTLEGWIASGHILARVISRERSHDILSRLREAGFGVTAVTGDGRDGHVLLLFVVALRRRGHEMLRLIQEVDPKAFVTLDPVTRALGGHLPHVAAPTTVRK